MRRSASAVKIGVGPYRWDDFVALPDDDRRELIDGELVEVEVPGFDHEHVALGFAYHLRKWAKVNGGVALISGYKVRISDVRGVMPDAQFFCADNIPSRAQNAGLAEGRPDVAIEVITPSRPSFDRAVKLGYYASIKVPEYWLVEPRLQTVEQFVYSPKGYVIAKVYEAHETLTTPMLPDLEIPLSDVWDDPRPPRIKAKPSSKRIKASAKKRSSG